MSEELVQRAESILHNIDLKLISQGAEALVFETQVHPYSAHPSLKNNEKFIIKYRPPKAYRHPKIDATITKSRTIGEVKFMHKLFKLGIKCPQIILADFKNGMIWMEYLGRELPDGNISSLKNWLWYLEKNFDEERPLDKDVETVCFQVGQLIGRLHFNDLIHGDLTSSNIIMNDDIPCLIDFGLSSYSALPEDKAVDLYVLERAILSTHSRYAEEYTRWLLMGYKDTFETQRGSNGRKSLDGILARLDEVRLRGRKRSMLG